ncbi:MAG TPA: hypothetical protein VGS06_15555 [Streptosporangiaceae bacterium]|nr:hypothetical protein [Streptosporangiaceae bacterium]
MPSDSLRPVTLAELVATLSLVADLGILGPGRGYALARRGQ